MIEEIPEKKKRINSKAKGGSFERLTSKKLSKWLTLGLEEYALWRVSGSGSIATNLSKKKARETYIEGNSGDICVVSKHGKFPHVDGFFEQYVVECKSYAKIELWPPLKNPLKGFLEQCQRESKESGKDICLIMKANNRKTLIGFSGVEFDNFTKHLEAHIILSYENILMWFFLFDELMENKL